MEKYYLQAKYDNRNEFYRKAEVCEFPEDKTIALYSYGTLVAYIEDGEAIVKGTYSATTLRHIKEFLKQNGFKATTKAQIESDYMKVGE